MVTTPKHEYLLASLSAIARALKMEWSDLRSLLRGQESKYLQPIDDTPRGFYTCSDSLLFACIARFGSAMAPALRESLRGLVSGPGRSVWQGAHLGGEAGQTFLGIAPGSKFPMLGSAEELSERCKQLGIRLEPLKLDVGKLSKSLHADLRKIQASYPAEVKSFEAWAEIHD